MARKRTKWEIAGLCGPKLQMQVLYGHQIDEINPVWLERKGDPTENAENAGEGPRNNNIWGWQTYHRDSIDHSAYSTITT